MDYFHNLIRICVLLVLCQCCVIKASRDSIIFPSPENFEGDHCKRKIDGVSGICKKISYCPKAVQIYQQYGVRPDLCVFQNREPIICCSENNLYNQQNSSDQYQSIINQIPNGISTNKCLEYGRIEESPYNSRRLPQPQVTGGVRTGVGEFPHMAAIGWTTNNNKIEWNCGGSLISEKFVLTAAHCTLTNLGAPDKIRLTDQHIGNSYYGSTDYDIIEIIKHPDYKRGSYYDDVALIRLDNDVRFSVLLRPACLWQTHNISYTTATVTGWGHTEYGGQNSRNLIKAELPIVSNYYCKSYYTATTGLDYGVVFNQMCAGGSGQRDTCQGDSGGPLQIRQYSSYGLPLYYIVGITSFGQGCGTRTPGIYTRISSYVDWIESIVWPIPSHNPKIY